MKSTFFTILFALGIGILSANAQTPTTTPPPPSEQDMVNPDAKEKEFPADVIDSTINDTSDIDDIKVDSTLRMEDKETYEKRTNKSKNTKPKKEQTK